jgi:uncharacterized membrane protein
VKPTSSKTRRTGYRRGRASFREGRGWSPGWWLIATLIAMFPANVHMAMNPDEYPGFPGGATVLWARLPLQAVFIAGVRAAMQADDVPQH